MPARCLKKKVLRFFRHIRMSPLSGKFCSRPLEWNLTPHPHGDLLGSRLPPTWLICGLGPVTVAPLHLIQLAPLFLQGSFPGSFDSPPSISLSPAPSCHCHLTAFGTFSHCPQGLEHQSSDFLLLPTCAPLLAILRMTFISRFLCCLRSRPLRVCSAFQTFPLFNIWILKRPSSTLTPNLCPPFPSPSLSLLLLFDRVVTIACGFLALLRAQQPSLKTSMPTCLPWQGYGPPVGPALYHCYSLCSQWFLPS